MLRKIVMRVLFPAGLLLFSACAGREPTPSAGRAYPSTDKVQTVFQRSQIPEQCRVFAHLFATLPAQYTGKQFEEAVAAEAKAKGADMMLIGQSRQCTSETELAFTYYGPDREYKANEWPGWNFGAEDWSEQGGWANIGYGEWGNSSIRFDYPVVLQMAFLRCQP